MTEQPGTDYYRPRTVEKCQCGGLLWADYADPVDMEAHVRHHRATYRHKDWARRQDFVGYDEGVLDDGSPPG